MQVVAVFGIGSGVGVIVGGMIGQFLYNKRRRYMPLFTGAPELRRWASCHCSTYTISACRRHGSWMCPATSSSRCARLLAQAWSSSRPRRR